MKALKNKILSVLLFTFAFFVMHDHIMASLYSDAGYELSSMQATQKPTDVKASIHKSIHTSLDLNCEEKTAVYVELSEVKPYIYIAHLTSYIQLVPQRPPLT